MIYFGSGGGWTTAKAIRAGGSAARNVYVAVNGAWRLVWSAFSATATGGSFTRNNGNSNTPRTIATAIGVYATPVGGSGSYAYSWGIVSTSGVTNVSISNANSQSATVNATCSLNGGGSMRLQCDVTDTRLGVTATTYANTSYNYYNTL